MAEPAKLDDKTRRKEGTPERLDDETRRKEGTPGRLDDEARMPFVEHLRELRLRLRNAIIALLIGFAIAYAFKDHVIEFLLTPCIKAWQTQQASNDAVGRPTLYYTDLLGPFWAFLSLSLFSGVFLASPFVFHQLWKFIAPGLYKHERRYGIGFAITSAVCFVGGALFCYYLVLPTAFKFFLGYSSPNIANVAGQSVSLTPIPTIDLYLTLERNLLLGFGLVFELPLVVFFLSLIGVVTYRGLWKFNRWWIILSFVIGAILTPTPDAVLQTLMAGPLIGLYNLSILISYIMTKRRERREAALARDEAPGDDSSASPGD